MNKKIQITNTAERRPRRSEFIEAGLGFCLLLAINFLWYKQDIGFLAIHPHPFWLIILPMAARYGFRAGLFSSLMAAALYLVLTRLGLEYITAHDLLTYHYLTTPFLFLAVGIILGEMREMQVRKYQKLEFEFTGLRKAHRALQGRYEALNQVKRELSSRIISQEDTLSTLYEAAQGLRSLKEAEIYPAILTLLSDYCAAESSSFYVINNDSLNLKDSAGDANHPRSQVIALDEGLMGQVLTTGETASINTMIGEDDFTAQAGAGILVSVPVSLTTGELMGVINIEKMPFMKFNRQNLRLLELVADWAGSALDNARTYQKSNERNVLDEFTGVYTNQYMVSRLDEEFKRAMRYGIPLSLIIIAVQSAETLVETEQNELRRLLSTIINQKLRTIDLLFHGKEWGDFILSLPNTPASGAAVVLEKIRQELKDYKLRGGTEALVINGGSAEITAEMSNSEQLINKAGETMVRLL